MLIDGDGRMNHRPNQSVGGAQNKIQVGQSGKPASAAKVNCIIALLAGPFQWIIGRKWRGTAFQSTVVQRRLIIMGARRANWYLLTTNPSS
jgi:hypothetical protein